MGQKLQQDRQTGRRPRTTPVRVGNSHETLLYTNVLKYGATIYITVESVSGVRLFATVLTDCATWVMKDPLIITTKLVSRCFPELFVF